MTTISSRPTPCIMNCGRGAARPIMPIAFPGAGGSSNFEWIHPACYRQFRDGVAHLETIRAARRRTT